MKSIHATLGQISALSCIFAIGFAIGVFKLGSIVKRVGHVRAFACFTATLVACYLAHGIFKNPTFWIVLRFFTGGAFGGLLLIVESWLIAASQNGDRGRVLGLYMISIYLAMTVGQLLIEIWDLNVLHAFSVAAIICVFSIVPLALSSSEQPRVGRTNLLSAVILFKLAKIGLATAFVSGLVLINIFGMLPLFLIEQPHVGANDVGLYMAICIFGGVILQYPIGLLSDRFNRPLLIVLNCLMIIVACICLIQYFEIRWLAKISLFIFGGLSFSLYPIGVSHTCDRLNEENFIPGSQSLLLFYSLGSAVGPILSGITMEFYGVKGLFIFVISTLVALTIFIIIALLLRKRLAKPQEPHIAIPSGTTPVVSKIDPRPE